ncbi:MAG: AAA family ATPase [Leptospiraceae bacterium]|nr:AAA family ATPase [Leptospiraceae bacterium]
MIISKIVIENFLCYFDKKTFNLSSGLNIILGENGEGKTKFYEALDWMFMGSVEGNVQKLNELISAKKKKETKVGSSFDVSVTIEVRQFNETKNVKKSFIVKKESETIFNTSTISVTSTIEKTNGTHETVDGNILDSIFPFQYRKFSMFKGEQEFKVLEREGSFDILVETFSESKVYDKFAQTITEMKKIREKLISQEGKRSQSEILKYAKTKNAIDEKEKEKKSLADKFDVVIENKNSLEQHIKQHESSVANSEEIEQLNKNIDKLQENIKEKEA